MIINRSRVARSLINELQKYVDDLDASPLNSSEKALIDTILNLITQPEDYMQTSGLEIDEAEPEEEYDDIETDFDFFMSSANENTNSQQSSESNYFPSQESSSAAAKLSNSKRQRIIKIMKKHPNYSYASFKREKISKSLFYKLKEEAAKGPPFRQCLLQLDQQLFTIFKYHLSNGAIIRDIDIRRWSLIIATQLKIDNKFYASDNFILRFKMRHKIRQRRITHFRTAKEWASEEESSEKGKQFVELANLSIPNFSQHAICNTDQTAFQRETHRGSSLAIIGSSKVIAKAGDKNALTHSYTVMPTISISGHLSKKLYICLQETNGQFGPRISENVNNLAHKLGNVFVDASKSGKMGNQHFKNYLNHCYWPFAEETNLLILDSWKPFTNTTTVTSTAPEGKSVTVMNIPPRNTGERQPLDRLFFKIYKQYIKMISDYSFQCDDFQAKLHDRLTIIKLQSLAHHQFSSPRFSTWIQKAWIQCGYNQTSTSVTAVTTPVKFAFDDSNFHKTCHTLNCTSVSFIRCTWCTNCYCFTHCFNTFHFSNCKSFVE